MKFFSKQTAALLLLALFILSVFADRELERYYYQKQGGAELSFAPSAVQLHRGFLSILGDYGIQDSCISSRSLAKKNLDSLKEAVFVRIPNDLPQISVLEDLNRKFYGSMIRLSVQEEGIGGRSEIKIYVRDVLKFQAYLYYDKTLKRKELDFCFLLHSAEKLSQDEYLRLESLPYSFAISLIPSPEAQKAARALETYNKEYVVLLNDDISATEFKLDANFSDDRLRSSIRNIMGSFPDASFYTIDSESKLSALASRILPELKKRNEDLNYTSGFTRLNEDNDSSLRLSFENLCLKGIDRENRIVYTSAKSFLKIQDLILKFKKMGNRFKLPSEMDTAN